MSVKVKTPVIMHEDNQSCIHMITGEWGQKRLRHMNSGGGPVCHTRPGIVMEENHIIHENPWARLQSFGWEIMEHAPYRPVLTPSDYHVFGSLKKFLAGQRFISDNAKTAVWQWFHTQLAEFYNSGISKLVVRWDKCLNWGGDYVNYVPYFDFPVYVLLWLKKNRGKDFSICLHSSVGFKDVIINLILNLLCK
ncbi:hypothetical protein B7P43_G01902 [Cryptotermes secundus]|uniref:Tc1-like transposase DDE domain-containing protein n=1 Tax=Cryptotermes secundus TaxID=105785 RepID=A0A2J7QIC6_9NEOP|nr:hypothetical protein B7P43_G01902 [Cryptotermes secundus]